MSCPEILIEAVPVFPQVMPGVRAWPFFEATSHDDASYVFGCDDSDRYIFVPGRRLDIVQAAIERLDGSRSGEAVAAEILRERAVRLDVTQLREKLDAAGLLTSSDPAQSEGDVDKLSIRLGSFDLSAVLRGGHHIARLVPPLAGFCLLLILAALSLLALKITGLFTLRAAIQAGLTELHFSWDLIAIARGTLFIHEGAHLLAGSYFGLKRARGKLMLVGMVLPMMALKLRGFCTLSARRRFAVWGAGVFVNFAAASAGLLLLQWGPPAWAPVLRNIIAVNWLVGVLNLFPFLPTDGYYMMGTLLRQINVRMRAIAMIGALLNWRGVRPPLSVALYALVTLLLVARAVFNNVRHLIAGALAHHPEIYIKSAVVLILLGFLFRTVWKTSRPAASTSPRSGLL
jgi:Zn-dependent protease